MQYDVCMKDRANTRLARRKDAPAQSTVDDLLALFPPGAIERKLHTIGQSVPEREWRRLPDDALRNLDRHLE
jgi:hypothetical protein